MTPSDPIAALAHRFAGLAHRIAGLAHRIAGLARPPRAWPGSRPEFRASRPARGAVGRPVLRGSIRLAPTASA